MQMRKGTKTLAILTAIMLMAAMLPAAAMAAEADFTVVRDGTTVSADAATINKELETGSVFTITLNRSVGANLVLPAGKTFTLKLNGNTLTGASDDAIANKGALTVEGPGAVRNDVSGKGALVNYPGSTAHAQRRRIQRDQLVYYQKYGRYDNQQGCNSDDILRQLQPD